MDKKRLELGSFIHEDKTRLISRQSRHDALYSTLVSKSNTLIIT